MQHDERLISYYTNPYHPFNLTLLNQFVSGAGWTKFQLEVPVWGVSWEQLGFLRFVQRQFSLFVVNVEDSLSSRVHADSIVDEHPLEGSLLKGNRAEYWQSITLYAERSEISQ